MHLGPLAQQPIPSPSAGDFGCPVSPVLGSSCHATPTNPFGPVPKPTRSTFLLTPWPLFLQPELLRSSW